MDKNFEYMQENITERTLYMWVFIPPGPARRKGGGHSFLRRGFVNRSGMCYDGKQRPVRPADWRAFLMGTKEYRMKKMEYYGRPMGALNLYMYLLLPAFVLYSAVMFVWRATVTSAQFASPAEFLTNLILLILATAALVSVYGADRYAFFSNVLFLPVLAVWRVLSTFSPSLFEPAAGAAAGAPSSAQTAIDSVIQNISTITQGVQTFAAGLPEGLQAAASRALEILSSASMGSGMGIMGGSMGDIGIGMMDAGMMGMDAGMMGVDGMAGEGAAAGGSLVAKLVGLFVKTGDDITLFVSTIECGLFVLLCLFFFFFFIKHAKFFLTPLDRFRARDELA